MYARGNNIMKFKLFLESPLMDMKPELKLYLSSSGYHVKAMPDGELVLINSSLKADERSDDGAQEKQAFMKKVQEFGYDTHLDGPNKNIVVFYDKKLPLTKELEPKHPLDESLKTEHEMKSENTAKFAEVLPWSVRISTDAGNLTKRIIQLTIENKPLWSEYEIIVELDEELSQEKLQTKIETAFKKMEKSLEGKEAADSKDKAIARVKDSFATAFDSLDD